MEKLKNALIIIAFVGGFIAIIGLLMAYSDGYLDGTVMADILAVVGPSFLSAFLLTINISYWFGDVFKKYIPVLVIFLISLVAAILVVLFIPTEIKNILFYIILGMTVLSLIVLWFRNITIG